MAHLSYLHSIPQSSSQLLFNIQRRRPYLVLDCKADYLGFDDPAAAPQKSPTLMHCHERVKKKLRGRVKTSKVQWNTWQDGLESTHN